MSSERDVLARELALVQAVVVGLARGVRLDQLGRLLLDARLDGRLEAAARHARGDGAPHLVELGRVGERARVVGRDPRAEEEAAVRHVVARVVGVVGLGELPRSAAVVDEMVVHE
eukprot:3037678-Prymnesium_polylepis.1